MTRVALGLAVLLPFLAGCFMMTVRTSFSRYSADRAAFELQCPIDQLEIVGLNRSLDDPAAAGSQVGVTGCGKRAVYVLVAGAGWVLNSDSRER
jgi:hypothetical protein